jgi:hypothetical protein
MGRVKSKKAWSFFHDHACGVLILKPVLKNHSA